MKLDSRCAFQDAGAAVRKSVTGKINLRLSRYQSFCQYSYPYGEEPHLYLLGGVALHPDYYIVQRASRVKRAEPSE